MSLKRYSNGRQSSQLSDTLIFVFGGIISVLFPVIVSAAYFGPVLSTLILIASSLGVLLGLARYMEKANSARQKEILRLLKTQHQDFFDQVRINVVRLLGKSAPNERRLPGSS
jgi:hypothetical protein